jgi:hypothetical protein
VVVVTSLVVELLVAAYQMEEVGPYLENQEEDVRNRSIREVSPQELQADIKMKFK